MVKEINESSWYVFTDPKYAHRVKACTQDGLKTIKCDCKTWEKVNTCKHIEEVMKHEEEKGNPFDYQMPVKKDLHTDEYIGGNFTSFLTNFLQKLTF